jgi:hypothetical protein
LVAIGLRFRRPQQNFKDWLQQQLGKSVDDPDAYINRYPENRITTRDLPNGNLELQYRGGHLAPYNSIHVGRVTNACAA